MKTLWTNTWSESFCGLGLGRVVSCASQYLGLTDKLFFRGKTFVSSRPVSALSRKMTTWLTDSSPAKWLWGTLWTRYTSIRTSHWRCRNILWEMFFVEKRLIFLLLLLMCLQAEDRVDELCKDLTQTRHRLEATEEVMRHKEEETAMVRTRTLHL